MAAPTVTSEQREPAEGGVGDLYLLVVAPDLSVTHRLEPGASLLIGRAEDAPVRLLDPQASRYHARLRVGDELELEDLGSANGTRVRDRPVLPGSPVVLRAGEAIAIGDTVLTVQRRQNPPRGRSPRSHAAFEAQVIEECARAERVRGTFAVVRLHVEGTAGAERVVEILDRSLRPGDMLAAYGPREYEVLLPDSDRPRVDAVIALLCGSLRAEGLRIACGLAFYPTDGTSPQALVTRANDQVNGSPGPVSRPGMVLRNAKMQALHALAGRAAATTINVLILGETGVGKEVLAEAIHAGSPRARVPLVTINCAALSESLLESELFGYEKGAFTGAQQAKAGLLETADGGTVFLDEVGEMSLPLQAKLLRAIECKQVLRVGGTRPRSIDVRFIAATNRELEDEVTSKTFRQDLYFRLNGLTLLIPPLRERLDEIEPLARLFIERAARQLGRRVPDIDPEVLVLLQRYSWPGNIRELRNVLERALLLGEGDRLNVEHLPPEKMRPPAAVNGAPSAPLLETGGVGPWRARVEASERQAIVEALSRCAGNQTRAAELLGIPRRTFCTRLKEYGILRPREAAETGHE